MRDRRIDFLLPRRPISSAEVRRKHISILIFFVACVCTALGLAASRVEGRLQAELARVRQDLQRSDQEIQQRMNDYIAAVDWQKWQEQKVQWSDRLARLIEQLPTNEQLVLSRIDAKSTKGEPPHIELAAIARDTATVQKLTDRFAADDRFSKPELKKIEPRVGDVQYNTDVSLKVESDTNEIASIKTSLVE